MTDTFIKGTDVIKTCRRCKEAVFIVSDTPHPRTRPVITYQVDIEPINGPNHTPPFFEHAGDGYWVERGRLLPGADAYHAVHHCEPPARCKHCEQVHINNNNERQKQ
jgi:hypothetical protein